MAGSLNKVTLIGNVGADPEIKSLNSGDRVANIRLATSETWKDKGSGEKKERTEWHRIVVFGDGLVRVIESYVRKGSKIYISGALQTRKWNDQAGVEKSSTEIVLKPYNGELILLSGKAEGGSDHGGGYSGGQSSGAASGGANAGPDVDDTIPF
jgi:single-strand DNA-binding protein